MLTEIDKQAIEAGLGFGGLVKPDYLHVVERLKDLGYVNYIEGQRSAFGEIKYYYTLTKLGNSKAMDLINDRK